MFLKYFGLLSVCAASAYGWMPGFGLPRTDFNNINFQVQSAAVPGLANAYGVTLIPSSGTDVLRAVQGAANQWSSSSIPSTAIHFGTVIYSANQTVANDGVSLLVMQDTAANRSFLGCSDSGTSVSCWAAGITIYNSRQDSDIILAPDRTWDETNISRVVRHELGHLLGAGHSGIYMATMWPMSSNRITSDDIAFATATYPASGAKVGSIQGKLLYSDTGSPQYGLVTASGRLNNVVVGALVQADGSFTISGIPQGEYIVTTQPLGYYITPGTVGLSSADMYQVGCYGGCIQNPLELPVRADQATMGANIVVKRGSPTFQFSVIGVTTGDSHSNTFYTQTFADRLLTAGADRALLLFINDTATGTPRRLMGKVWSSSLDQLCPIYYDTGVTRSGRHPYRTPVTVRRPVTGWPTVIVVDEQTHEAAVADGWFYIPGN